MRPERNLAAEAEAAKANELLNLRSKNISHILAQRENRIIGHEAHIGGAIFGLIATIVIAPQSLSIFSQQVAGFLGGG